MTTDVNYDIELDKGIPSQRPYESEDSRGTVDVQ